MKDAEIEFSDQEMGFATIVSDMITSYRKVSVPLWESIGLTSGQPKIIRYLVQHNGCNQKGLSGAEGVGEQPPGKENLSDREGLGKGRGAAGCVSAAAPDLQHRAVRRRSEVVYGALQAGWGIPAGAARSRLGTAVYGVMQR